MSTVTTDGEIPSTPKPGGPPVDSPAVSTRARARVPVTVGIGNVLATVRGTWSRWWAWTARPLSLRATWHLSRVDSRRVPGDSTLLRVLWRLSNTTDRLLMFALVLTAPTFLTGPLRWLVARPTRRWGLYLTVAVFAVALLVTRKG
jgi:sterol desaturase/sphingolipid hydroxylase (fatty acid hydroxylase superfamily)